MAAGVDLKREGHVIELGAGTGVVTHALIQAQVPLDRLVVMDGGRIVESGSHDALIAANGLYAGLWARQSGGFIGRL